LATLHKIKNNIARAIVGMPKKVLHLIRTECISNTQFV